MFPGSLSKYSIPAFFIMLVVFYSAHFLLTTKAQFSFPDDWTAITLLREYETHYQMLRQGELVKSYTFVHDCPRQLHAITWTLFRMLSANNWHYTLFLNQLCYLLLALVFTFLLAKQLGTPDTGVWACLILAVAPGCYNYFPRLSTDFASAAAVTAVCYAVIRADGFRCFSWSIILAVTIWWALLLKCSNLIFIAGPLVITLAIAIKNRRLVFNAARNLLCLLVVLLVLYSPFLSLDFLNRITQYPSQEPLRLPWFTWERFQVLIPGYWENQVGLPCFFLLVAGIYLAFKRQQAPRALILLSGIVIPDLFIVLMPHWKAPHYLLPHLPLLAIFSAITVSETVRFRWGKLVLSLLFIMSLFQYLQLVTGLKLPGLNRLFQYQNLPRGEPHDFSGNLARLHHELRRNSELLAHNNAMAATARPPRFRLELVLLTDDPRLRGLFADISNYLSFNPIPNLILQRQAGLMEADLLVLGTSCSTNLADLPQADLPFTTTPQLIFKEAEFCIYLTPGRQP